MLKTEKITYNVRERGRKALGVDRDFDTVALAKLINGAEIQERVKLGDMLGYYGHWPRIKFGMATQEGGILDGKAVPLPTAIRTTYLRAESDGTITHQAEFLDTDAGQIAEKLYQSKAGGFSSAIDSVPGTSPTIASNFWGYDYVLTPNYHHNRGYQRMLDAVGCSGERKGAMALLDAAMEESIGAAGILNAMFDSLSKQHINALQAMERLALENDELISRLASGKKVFDSAVMEDMRVGAVRGTQAENFERFRTADLSRLQSLPSNATQDSPELSFARNRYGIKV